MKLFLTAIAALVCIQHAWATITEYAPVVETKNGKIVGIVREFEDEKVNLYQGIRYGESDPIIIGILIMIHLVCL